MMRNEDAAMDLSQAAWVKGWQRLHQFHGDSSFATWMTRVTINLCLDQLRKDKRRRADSIERLEEDSGGVERQMPVTTRNPTERLELQELRVRIDEALQKLTWEHRTALVLHEFERARIQENRNRDGMFDRHSDVSAFLRSPQDGEPLGRVEERTDAMKTIDDDGLRLQAYLDGELDAEQTAGVEKQLEESSELRSLLNELRETRDTICNAGEVRRRVDCSRDFYWAQIRRGIESERRLETPVPAQSVGIGGWIGRLVAPIDGRCGCCGCCHCVSVRHAERGVRRI